MEFLGGATVRRLLRVAACVENSFEETGMQPVDEQPRHALGCPKWTRERKNGRDPHLQIKEA